MRISGSAPSSAWQVLDRGLVARQQPIEVGDVIGNEAHRPRRVEGGRSHHHVSIQKIGNGAPVKPE